MDVRKYIILKNYFNYFTDNVIVRLYLFLMRRQGVIIGGNVRFLGIPVIDRFDGSKLSIEKNCLICSRPSQTALGVAHQVILRTLNESAVLRLE
jgi:hypothetical protein